MRSHRDWSRPGDGRDDRCALGRQAGADPVAQAPLDLPRGRLRGGLVRRAGPGGLRAARSAEHARDPVGDRPAPARGRDDPGAGPAQLGTTWNTLWSQVQPVLAQAAGDPSRFEGVQVIGVDEHIWHHRDPRRRGPKALTGMVDLTRGPHPTARLLDLVPGRSGKAYRDWLDERGETFREGIQIATLDPFQGYKNAIDDQLEDATCVLDAFHIVKLGTAAVDDVRRRIQQETLGHRGRKGDPLYGIRHILRAGRERLTQRQQTRLASAFAANPDHVAVEVAYHCSQDLRDVFHQPTPARGRQLAERLIASLPSCPIPEIARLGKTLRRWRTAFLAYFDTDGASNGGTEAVNGLIELGRRTARGFRNFEHYRLRMLLITGGLDPSPHTQL